MYILSQNLSSLSQKTLVSSQPEAYKTPHMSPKHSPQRSPQTRTWYLEYSSVVFVYSQYNLDILWQSWTRVTVTFNSVRQNTKAKNLLRSLQESSKASVQKSSSQCLYHFCLACNSIFPLLLSLLHSV